MMLFLSLSHSPNNGYFLHSPLYVDKCISDLFLIKIKMLDENIFESYECCIEGFWKTFEELLLCTFS
jgi:hypothetical protein